MIGDKEKLTDTKMEDREDEIVMDALANASSLYNRYVEIVDVANIAAFQQNLPLSNPETIPPLGLVIWPTK
jgi:hypothetical protein